MVGFSIFLDGIDGMSNVVANEDPGVYQYLRIYILPADLNLRGFLTICLGYAKDFIRE
jgi:hypothetical protein